MKVYLASPFFNDMEIETVNKVKTILESKGLTVFSPMENQFGDIFEVGSSAWSLATFNNDKKFIDWADIVVAVYHGQTSDSGTAWEIGYAYGTNKPVIVIHLDNPSNLMIHEGSHANINIADLPNYDFEKLPSVAFCGEMY